MKTMKNTPRVLTRVLALLLCMMAVLALVSCASGETKADTSDRKSVV